MKYEPQERSTCLGVRAVIPFGALSAVDVDVLEGAAWPLESLESFVFSKDKGEGCNSTVEEGAGSSLCFATQCSGDRNLFFFEAGGAGGAGAEGGGVGAGGGGGACFLKERAPP